MLWYLKQTFPESSIVSGRNYDFWLGSLAKFPLSENSDKIRLTELAKNQTFPLFMTSLRLMLALQPPAPNYCWLGIFGAKPSATEKKHKQKKNSQPNYETANSTTQRQTIEGWRRVWVIVGNNKRMKWTIVVGGKNTNSVPSAYLRLPVTTVHSRRGGTDDGKLVMCLIQNDKGII